MLTSKMNLRNFIIFCVLFKYTCADVCSTDSPKTTEARLRKKLLCDYEKTLRPVFNHENTTTVKINMVLKNIEFNQYSDSITVRSWMIMKWKDQHLTWNKNDYGDIKELHVSSDTLWTPELALYNAESGSVASYTTTCLVESDGDVMCIPPLTHVALCVPNLTRWPFDTQNCSLRLGSWVHTGEEVDYVLANNNTNVSMDGYQPNREWNLVSVEASRFHGKYDCCPNQTFPSIRYQFLIERHSASHAATVIAPALVMIVLCLSTFLLEPAAPERSCLVGINLLCHFSYMQQLSWYVPYNGDTCPLAVLFFRDSMIMTCVSVVITLIVRNIARSASSAPVWIANLCNYAVSTRPGQILIFCFRNNQIGERISSDEVSLIADQEEKRKEWLLLAVLIDRIMFIIYILTYAILMLRFLP